MKLTTSKTNQQHIINFFSSILLIECENKNDFVGLSFYKYSLTMQVSLK
jgi:hypothetical protein